MKTSKLMLAAFLVALITGCGGGGSSSQIGPITPNPPPPTAGITRTGIAAGVVTGFGSIIVNGVHYETNTAQFVINGLPGSQSDLAVGQVVIVKGELNDDNVTGTATDVLFNDNVKGPVESIDTATSSLVILGQTVIADSSTSFDDSIPGGTLSGIQVGDIIEVSGLVNANGAVVATRLELKPAGTTFEVVGLVSVHDAANSTFQINQLVVDYSAAMINDFPTGQIEDGQLVEVKGTTLTATGTLEATIVEFKGNEITGDLDDFIELEGFITRFVDSGDFDVAGISVTTSASTLFEGGDATDLDLNVKVEVEGVYNATGGITASKIDIRRAKAVRMEALVDSVDAGNNRFVVLGITITVDALTRLEDKSDADLEPFGIGNLNPGDYVEVRGSEFPAGSNSVIAAIVEREDVDPDTILQGFVTDFTDPVISVLSVSIDTSNAVFRDENNALLGRPEFFNRLDINSLIKVKGIEIGTSSINAEEVEFEIEN